jgi:hypothetical protein
MEPGLHLAGDGIGIGRGYSLAPKDVDKILLTLSPALDDVPRS